MAQYEKLNSELTSIHYQYNAQALRFRPSGWLNEAQAQQQGYAGEWRERIYLSDLAMYRYFLSLTRARTWLETNLDSSVYSVQPESGIDPKVGPYIGWSAFFKRDADYDRFQAHMEDEAYLQAKQHEEPLKADIHAIREGSDPVINAETKAKVAASLNALAAAGTEYTYTEAAGRHEIHIPEQATGDAKGKLSGDEVKTKLLPP